MAYYNGNYDFAVINNSDPYYHAFWDTLQNNGGGKNYNFFFAYDRFTDATYNPKYDIVANADTTATYDLFNKTVLTDTKVGIYADKNLSRAFFSSTAIKIIRLLSVKATTVFSNTFDWCNNLESLTMAGEIGQNGFNVQYSTKLNKASIISIINTLSSTTSGLTVTLSKTAVNKAFETAEGSNDGVSSTEWADLIATKSNWGISLV